MKSTFLVAAASLALIACGDQSDVIEWMNGTGPQSQSSVPSMPSAITLASPNKSPSRITTPTLKISGVKSGLDVFVYKTSSCSTAIKSVRATSSTVQIKLPALSNGSYKFYTKAKNKFGYSTCKGFLAYTLDRSAPVSPSVLTPVDGSFVGATANISGSCEDGSTVYIAGDVNEVSDTCANGSFSIPVTFNSGEGSKNISVSQIDAADNVSSTNDVSYVKDSIAPTVSIGVLDDVNAANQNNYTLSGTCSINGDSISLSTPPGLASPTTCVSGAFSFSNLNLSSLSDTPVIFTVLAADTAGNNATDSQTVDKDTLEPVVEIDNPTRTSLNIGDVDYAVTYTGATDINLTNAAVNVTVTGTVTFTKSVINGTTPNATIRVAITGGNGKIDSVTIAAGSSHDSIGNLDSGASQGIDVNVDNLAPTISLSAISGYINNSNQNAFSISGTCNENGANVTITAPSAINGTTTTCSSSAFTFSSLDLHTISDGTIGFTVKIQDALNNFSTDSKSGTKDATAPSISGLSLSSPATSPGNDNTPDIQVSGTFAISDSFQLFADATCTTPRSSSATASATNSIIITTNTLAINTTYTFFAKGTDAAGNTSCSGAGISVSYTLDTVLPTLTFTTGSNVNNSNKTSYNIGGACTGENGRTVRVTAPAAMSALSATCTSNVWSMTGINMTGITDGPITMTVSLTDAAGNTRNTNRSVTKDVVTPTAAITSLPAIDASNQYNYSFSGTCSANGDTVSINSPVTGYNTTCTSGAFTLSGLNVSGAADGTVVFWIQNVDLVGNNVNVNASTTKSVGDITPPSDPRCDSLGGNATPTKSDTITFRGSDDDSGINHYEMRLYRPGTDKNITEWIDIGAEVNPYQFTGLSDPQLRFHDYENEGEHVDYIVYIRAIDNYGNNSNEVECPKFHLKPAYGNFTGTMNVSEDNASKLNLPDFTDLNFDDDRFNPAYLDHRKTIEEGRPEEIIILQPGNYMVSHILPLVRKYGNHNSTSASAKSIVLVNGQPIRTSYAANSLTWGSRPEHDNPIQSSNHLTTLLTNLKKGDIVTFASANNADPDETLVMPENQRFSAYLEYIPDEDDILFVTARKTDIGENLNLSEAKVQWGSEVVDENSFSLNSEENPYSIEFKADGDYFISFNLPFERVKGETTQKIEAHIYIDGQEIRDDVLMHSSNGIISNLNDHRTSSTNFTTVARNVKNKQVLEVILKRVGEDGEIIAVTDKVMSLFMHRIPSMDKNYFMATSSMYPRNWNVGDKTFWTDVLINDPETFEHTENSQKIIFKKAGDYIVILNIQVNSDTDFIKPIIQIGKNGQPIPSAVCTSMNMTISPGEASVANCEIHVLIQDMQPDDFIYLMSGGDSSDGVSNAVSAPKITIRKVSETIEELAPEEGGGRAELE